MVVVVVVVVMVVVVVVMVVVVVEFVSIALFLIKAHSTNIQGLKNKPVLTTYGRANYKIFLNFTFTKTEETLENITK
jgi:hypothetical protein